MSYNLKNRIITTIAMSFAVVMLTNRAGHAQALAAPSVIEPQPHAAVPAETAATDSADAALDFLNEQPNENAALQAKHEKVLKKHHAMNNENPAKNPAETDAGALPAEIDATIPAEIAADGLAAEPANAETDEEGKPVEAAEPEEAKSPFEKFGNSILSKVDSDLFNQMANIEKQTTLLNLELKREDLRNRVEALKAARVRAQNEEKLRLMEEEEKAKDKENQRKLAILEEERKLRDKEIELEKTRQAKVLNDYMNDMLIKNQQWIEKNAKLQSRIRDLEAERKNIIADFHAKTDEIKADLAAIQLQADNAVSTHFRLIADLESRIGRLKESLVDSENKLRRAEEGDNPFGESLSVDANAVDLSQEYAIMDITGRGEDIVAKIVSKDGTTFMVHKGSMLKGGEVVTSITDHYIAFDNHGVKSFLYTGGTVLDFEPTKTFNGSDKTPEVTEKASFKTSEGLENRTDSSNNLVEKSTTPNDTASTKQNRNKRQRNKKSGGGEAPASVSSGMFVK